MTAAGASVEPIVIDTNIILDLFVFGDPMAAPLRQQLDAGTLGWVATQPMRDDMGHAFAALKLAMDIKQGGADELFAKGGVWPSAATCSQSGMAVGHMPKSPCSCRSVRSVYPNRPGPRSGYLYMKEAGQLPR